MSTPKVSVIIPIYNTELYVKDAILSITNQTLKEIEIILINDGSTDNSSQIIELLACSDDRIQLYNQENQGQSVARNLGISKATGKYLYFMDSDDLLELDALECCYNKCDADELDFVFFDADIISDNDELNIPYDYFRPEIKEITYKGIELFEWLVNSEQYRSALCLSFISKKFLDKIGLTFYPGIIHEDELFSTIIYLEARKVGRINKPYFKRRLRTNSTITNEFSWKNIIGYNTSTDELKKRYKNKKEQQIVSNYINRVINAAIRNSYKFSFKNKLKLLIHPIVQKNIRIIKPKSFLILLLKSYI